MDHLVAEPAAADEPGDDHDGEHHHDRLVHAEHDRGLGQRQLHLPQQLVVRRAERDRRLDPIVRAPAGCRGRSAGCTAAARRSSAAMIAGHAPDVEQRDHRHQVDELRQRLHRRRGSACIARWTRSLRADQIPSGIADRDADTITPTITWRQGVHRDVPHAPRTRSPRCTGTTAIASGHPAWPPRSAAAAAPRHTIHHGSAEQQLPERVERVPHDDVGRRPVVKSPDRRAIDRRVRRVVHRSGDLDRPTASGKSCWRSTWRPIDHRDDHHDPAPARRPPCARSTHPKRRTVGAPRVSRSPSLHP